MRKTIHILWLVGACVFTFGGGLWAQEQDPVDRMKRFVEKLQVGTTTWQEVSAIAEADGHPNRIRYTQPDCFGGKVPAIDFRSNYDQRPDVLMLPPLRSLRGFLEGDSLPAVLDYSERPVLLVQPGAEEAWTVRTVTVERYDLGPGMGEIRLVFDDVLLYYILIGTPTERRGAAWDPSRFGAEAEVLPYVYSHDNWEFRCHAYRFESLGRTYVVDSDGSLIATVIWR